MKLLGLLLFQVIILASYVNSAKILMLTPLGSKSHLNGYVGAFKILAEIGHEITFVSAYGASKQTKNIRHVVLPSEYGATTFVRNVFTEGTTAPMMNLMMKSPKMCSDSLKLDVIQELKKEKFDLVMLTAFMSDCYLSLVHHFKVPLIYVSPAGIIGPIHDLVGNPTFPALAGNVLLPGTFPYGYIYRMKATLIDLIVHVVVNYYNAPKVESMCREVGECPPDMPSFRDIRAHASLVMSNSVRMLDANPVPSMPHIVYVGGSHCGPAKPLPQDLEKWVQGSGDAGFIFFSLGSAITPSDMPESARKIFIKVFGKLKQRVLWKWDKEMDDLPSNVKLGKWLPQQDILAHPKLRLFISHGGMLSVMETTYHGTRLLGMPVFADQYNNIQMGMAEGWLEGLEWKDLTEKSLEDKIYAVFNNKEMDKVVAKRAKIMNDLPRPPKEEVVYWVEYVLRHKGAEHLRSPVHHMSWYILYNADVWATISAIVLGCMILFYLTLRTIVRRCFRKTNVVNKKKKKQ